MGIFRKNSPDLEGDTDLLTRPDLQEDDGGPRSICALCEEGKDRRIRCNR